MQRIAIDPITRLEGHGRIEIFLDDAGEVADVYFQVPELRGFEQFCLGRPAEAMPQITNRICGVCPEAHHMASVKALDELYGVTPPPAARCIRELLYMAFFVTDHATHFYALGGPDFIIGPDAPPMERNILGVARKVGKEVAGHVVAARKRNHQVIKLLGGREIHPVAGLPGGWSKRVTEEEREQLWNVAEANVAFARFTLELFHELVLGNPVYAELIQADYYCHQTYGMGTVDRENRLNLYDGHIRVVDPAGGQLARYLPADYDQHLAERVEPWSYLKFPYLREVGWRGFVDGPQSGVYCATPLSRLNVADAMATPLAQAEFERFYAHFGIDATSAGRRPPVHHRLATHWARLVELLYAAERMTELCALPELTDPQVRNLPEPAGFRGVGIGVVEAPRGTLLHHYEADRSGLLRKVNLIVGTTNNHAPIAMSLKRAAQGLIRAGEPVSEGTLNRIEMAFRLYDPCLSCATHALPGGMPLSLAIRDRQGNLLQTVGRGV